MKKNLKAPGVNVHYYEDETKLTGTCAVLIVGGERVSGCKFVSNKLLQIRNLKSPENWALVEKAKFFYIAGFFLVVSPESIQLVAEHAAQKGKIFMMNLASPYICECFTEAWMKVFPYMDYVFGDETEARTFAKAQGWEDADDSVLFFWATTAEDYLVLFDEPNVLKEGCGKSFAPFPRGCYFSTSCGLQSFEHPLNKLMPMPPVDSAFGNSRISSSGSVESSHGKLITNTLQEFTYDNLMNFQALGEQQIVNHTIATNSKVIVEAAIGIELSFEVDDFFTLYLDFNSLMAVINVSNALNKNVSIVDSSGMFFNSLNNNQNAGGDDTITSTQQTYNYQSTQGCYSKQVKAINSTLGIKSSVTLEPTSLLEKFNNSNLIMCLNQHLFWGNSTILI